jgi:acyl carrier protein
MIYQADIADREQAQHVIGDVQRTMGPLRGIMHAAMVLDEAPIERLNEERMWKAMAPKIMGAWNLHALTTDVRLDFFVLFSSIASIIGGPGLANYAAGNAFLDALAYYRRARGLPALTVNWGMVGEVGHLANNLETTTRLTRLGIGAIPASGMLDALDALVSSNAVQAAVAQLEWKEFSRSMGSRAPARFADLAGGSNAEEVRSTASTYVRDILEADEAARPPLLEAYIRDHMARAMGASPARIDTQQSLLNLGLDSLIAVDVRNRISADLGLNVSLATFMQCASINSLAAYMAERLQERDRRKPCSNSRGSPEIEADMPISGREPPPTLSQISA